MPIKHPPSHYLNGRLKPWWRQIQRAEEREAAEREAEEQREAQEREAEGKR